MRVLIIDILKTERRDFHSIGKGNSALAGTVRQGMKEVGSWARIKMSVSFALWGGKGP